MIDTHWSIILSVYFVRLYSSSFSCGVFAQLIDLRNQCLHALAVLFFDHRVWICWIKIHSITVTIEYAVNERGGNVRLVNVYGEEKLQFTRIKGIFNYWSTQNFVDLSNGYRRLVCFILSQHHLRKTIDHCWPNKIAKKFSWPKRPSTQLNTRKIEAAERAFGSSKVHGPLQTNRHVQSIEDFIATHAIMSLTRIQVIGSFTPILFRRLK